MQARLTWILRLSVYRLRSRCQPCRVILGSRRGRIHCQAHCLGCWQGSVPSHWDNVQCSFPQSEHGKEPEWVWARGGWEPYTLVMSRPVTTATLSEMSWRVESTLTGRGCHMAWPRGRGDRWGHLRSCLPQKQTYSRDSVWVDTGLVKNDPEVGWS